MILRRYNLRSFGLEIKAFLYTSICLGSQTSMFGLRTWAQLPTIQRGVFIILVHHSLRSSVKKCTSGNRITIPIEVNICYWTIFDLIWIYSSILSYINLVTFSMAANTRTCNFYGSGSHFSFCWIWKSLYM